MRIAGSMKRRLVTRVLTGFPGRAKTREEWELKESFAKVVGLPGFIFKRPKNTSPSFSRYGFIKSNCPMLTPPVDTMI